MTQLISWVVTKVPKVAYCSLLYSVYKLCSIVSLLQIFLNENNFDFFYSFFFSSPILGVPAQIPILSVTQTTGPDAAVSQAHLTPSPVPVSIQAVNQPLMPLPQTMSLYQDPLYPGFPCSEKGDRAIAPPYSLCQTGEDLPKGEAFSSLEFLFPQAHRVSEKEPLKGLGEEQRRII